MLRAAHDWDFDALRRKTEEFTILANDDSDLREASSDLSQVVQTGDTLKVVRIANIEETKVAVRSFDQQEFRQYQPHLQFSSEDYPPTDFQPRPLFCNDISHQSESFGMSTVEATTLNIPKPAKRKQSRPRQTSETEELPYKMVDL